MTYFVLGLMSVFCIYLMMQTMYRRNLLFKKIFHDIFHEHVPNSFYTYLESKKVDTGYHNYLVSRCKVCGKRIEKCASTSWYIWEE